MGHSLGKDPSEVQQAVVQMPQGQAITAAQGVPGPYDPAQDPFNYTGFTTYDNGQPITGYDWWAPGNPTVTQRPYGDQYGAGGSITTNPAGSGMPKVSRPKRTWADLSAGWNANPGLGMTAAGLPQSINANLSNPAAANSPSLDAYMQMMGGGNNYGAIIGGQQQQTPTPNTPSTPIGSAHPGTRYGMWNETYGGYEPYLPWGLRGSLVGAGDGRHVDIGWGGGWEPTGLKWDFINGNIVGGDAQADAFKGRWLSTELGGGLAEPWKMIEDGKTPPPDPLQPWWWESAHNPDFIHSAYVTSGPGDYTYNFESPLPDYIQSPAPRWARTAYWNGQPVAGSEENFPRGSSQANSMSLVPQANLGLGSNSIPQTNLGLGSIPQTANMVSGGGGYGAMGGGNPWGGLNGIEDAMTEASSFGNRRRRRV